MATPQQPVRDFDREIVSGSILRSVWKLTWPAALMQLINGSAGFVDHILVGRYVYSPDNAANAGIGVAWQLFLVVVVFMASLFSGMGVLVAQYAGRRDREAVSHIIYHTFLAALAFQFFFVLPVGWFIAPHLLDLVNAQPNVQAHALPYLRVLFACSLGMFLMFMTGGAMHASGDPKTPLKLAVVSTVLNISLSAALIVGYGPFPQLGAVGAAVGTVIAPIPSLIIAYSLLTRGKLMFGLPSRLTILPNLSTIRRVAEIGIPTGIQAVLLNVGGAALIAYVGSLENSEAAQAAYTICYAQWFALVTFTAFGLRAASATLIGQNIGAGYLERGKKAVGVTALIGALWATLVGIVFLSIPETLMGVFSASQEPVLGYGIAFLQVLAFGGVFLAMTLAFTGGLQGAGDTRKPMWIALITQIGILLGICEAARQLGLLSTNVVWMAVFISHAIRFAMTYYFFRVGHWEALRGFEPDKAG